MKVRLFAAAALAPLALAAPSLAQTTITGARTTPVQTSTVNGGQPGDVVIASGALVAPTTANTAAIVIDSNNTVTNNGSIAYNDLNDVTGVLIRGGFTGGFTNVGSINILESFTPTDGDNDGDQDGPLAQGARRYGVRLVGPGAFTGSITAAAASSILVEGNDSFGVSIESPLTGSFSNQGAITVQGDRSRALSITGGVGGDVRVLGVVTGGGENTSGVVVEAPVGGVLQLQGTIRASGYRFTGRPALPTARASLDADDLLQSGSAVRIAGSIARGVLVDAPPPDLSTTNADEDADGVTDANETTGAIRTFGSAPGMDIGSASADVTLGAVGTGANAYGLVIRGSVGGEGVYDGRSATGLRIGQPGAGAGATTLTGGLSVATGAAVEATAFEAAATAIQVNRGATVPAIVNAGAITAVGIAETAQAVTAVEINAGATVTTLRNDGVITAQAVGERAAATAVLDRSGSLGLVENRGQIVAVITPNDDSLDLDDPNTDPSDEIITGTRVALDLRANTTGVTLRQSGRTDTDADTADADGDGVDDADEPAIVGNVLFGSGDDVLDALNGVVVGDISFGAGADRLTVAGGAAVTGAVTDSDGRLAVDVQNGSLTLTNADTVNVTSVNVGGDGALTFAADSRAGRASRLTASGAVTVASGAQIGLRLNALQRGAVEYAVLSGGSLSVGQIDQTLLGQTPFLYAIAPRVDQAAKTLFIAVRPRTTAELGFNRSEAQAYDGVFNSLDLNPRIERAVLNRTDRQGLVALYDQLLPDHSGGALLSLSAVNDAIANVLSSRTEPRGRIGPNGAWAQEVFFNLRQDRDQALGFESQGFGVTGGFEGVGPDGGAIGLTGSFVTADYEDTDAVVGEQITFSMFEIGGYWRRVYRGFRFDARAAGGVVLFDSDRRFISTADNLALTNEADWIGFSGSGHLGVSYEIGSRFYARPYAQLDAVYLREGDYSESGGGPGFDLDVDSRSGGAVFASTGITAGARFGRETWFGPEVSVGYRGAVAGDPGATTARFRGATSGGAFTLEPEDIGGGGLQIRIAFRAGSDRGYIAFETGAESGDGYERYDIRIVAKVVF